MTKPALFATYLHDTMAARRMGLDEFEFELEIIPREEVESWLKGWSAPTMDQVTIVAKALHRTPEEVAVAWLIEQLPGLHAPLHADVLEPRGSKFPGPNDLTVRAATSRKSEARESMDVSDPHDSGRPSMASPPAPEGRVRKRPRARTRPE